MDDYILEKASSAFPLPIASLDSIHLASAILYSEEYDTGTYFILTHDKELANSASGLGFAVKGVET